MNNFYVVKNVVTNKLAPSIQWSNGKVEAVHLFVTRKGARDMTQRLNIEGKKEWRVYKVDIIIWGG